jgi:hypothetical protein
MLKQSKKVSMRLLKKKKRSIVRMGARKASLIAQDIEHFKTISEVLCKNSSSPHELEEIISIINESWVWVLL